MPRATATVLPKTPHGRMINTRQAGWMLGLPPSGENTGLVKRYRYWVCGNEANAGFLFRPSAIFPRKRRGCWVFIPPFRPSATFPGTHEKNASIFFMGAPSPASGGRDFFRTKFGLGRAPSGIISGFAPSGINTEPAKRDKCWVRAKRDRFPPVSPR